jgi:hypothetical protein
MNVILDFGEGVANGTVAVEEKGIKLRVKALLYLCKLHPLLGVAKLLQNIFAVH